MGQREEERLLETLPGLAVSPRLAEMEAPALQALLRSTDLGILMTDQEGDDIVCNPRFGELFQFDPEEVVRTSRQEMRQRAMARVEDPEAFNLLMEQIYADPMLEQEDEIALRGTPRRLLRRCTGPVRDSLGRNIGRFWIFEDVTRIRQLEREVQNYAVSLEQRVAEQARALEAAQERLLETVRIGAAASLAVGIAHDLRNILTTIRLEEHAEQTRLPPHIRQQLDRVHALSLRLLSLERPGSFHLAPISISSVLDPLAELLYYQAQVDGIEISRVFEPCLPLVLGDRQQLECLFINLIINGLNAMTSRGGQLKLRVSREGASVCIEVKDDGEGVPAAALPRLFEPFFTTRANRAGLGLYCARRIVEDHHGRISAESSPGQGASFRVWLPVVTDDLQKGE